MVIGNARIVGFDIEKLEALVGLSAENSFKYKKLLTENLELCPQKAKQQQCN